MARLILEILVFWLMLGLDKIKNNKNIEDIKRVCNKKNTFFLFIFIFCISLFPSVSFGASLYFDASGVSSFSSTQDFYIDLMLDTEGESVNALSVDISYDDNLISFVGVHQDDTVVTSWIESPRVNGDHIILSGIMAGGFSGLIDPVLNTREPGRVARFIFRANKEGESALSFHDFFVASNDGLGLAVKTEALPFILSLSKDAVVQKELVDDKTPPDIFKPLVSLDDGIFDGKYFLVFDTKDRGSGMSHFEIKEGRGLWVEATSPYEIHDQSLRKQIYVKAVDKSSNFRIVKTFDKGLPIQNVVILVVIFFAIVVVYRRYSLKKRPNKVYLENDIG